MSSLFKQYIYQKYNISFVVCFHSDFFIKNNSVFDSYEKSCEYTLIMNLNCLKDNYVLTQKTLDILQSKNLYSYKLLYLLIEIKNLQVSCFYYVKKQINCILSLSSKQNPCSFKYILNNYLNYSDFIVDTYCLNENDNGHFPLNKTRVFLKNKLKIHT